MGADYMRSEWVTLDVHEVLEFVFADSALKADTGSSAPRTFGEAVSRPDGQHFLQAAVDEVKALVDNRTFIVRERCQQTVLLVPDGSSSSSGKQMGLLTATRVVLLPRAFLNAPVLTSLRLGRPLQRWPPFKPFLLPAGFEDWDIEQVDISSAFLNGELEEDITMKALYGLRQSPLQWHKKLTAVMSELGFKKIESDSSIFVFLDEETGTRVIAPAYVDDITVSGTNSVKIAWTKAELKKHFKLRDMGPVDFFLVSKSSEIAPIKPSSCPNAGHC